uniref:NADH dehydrogenase subunit 3 n=1 Tax=Cricotopus trifascia TaxID=401643 RepID=UPI002E75AC40|nr:NADH dehydrogenase subunit 3 [Cricotopus trifascia]WPM93185.1 NADH dehydrogenase subunit 3 [Cricotopus trifascia]
MISLFFMGAIILMISMIVMYLATLLSKKTSTDREKMSPFECGFDPMNYSRIPFSIQFFLITIIFLIFDVEIALILPMIVIFKMSNLMWWTMTSMIFILILIIGLIHEWSQGALNWTN